MLAHQTGIPFIRASRTGQGIVAPLKSDAALDQARAALERDQAQLNYAKINFAREQKLFDQKLISRDELDTNEASLDTLLGTVSADKAAITNAPANST